MSNTKLIKFRNVFAKEVQARYIHRLIDTCEDLMRQCHKYSCITSISTAIVSCNNAKALIEEIRREGYGRS